MNGPIPPGRGGQCSALGILLTVNAVLLILATFYNITTKARVYIFQVNPQNKSQFEGISPERAFADFVFAHIILHLVVMNFIG